MQKASMDDHVNIVKLNDEVNILKLNDDVSKHFPPSASCCSLARWARPAWL